MPENLLSRPFNHKYAIKSNSGNRQQHYNVSRVFDAQRKLNL
jgi:hypothetical protein